MRPVRPMIPCAALLVAALAVPALAGPSVTVYTRDLGLVRETRVLELGGGRDTVRLDDVPERLDFGSLQLVPEGGARVGRLAYRFDVASGDGLLERARGSRVRVTSRGDRVTEGVLLASDGTWLVVRGDDGAVATLARSAVEGVRLATPPASLALRPAIEAVLEGGRRGRVKASLAYLTGGMSWTAEHVLVRRGETLASWSATVLVENTTGRDFIDADLKLIAGDPRQTAPTGMPVPRMAMTMMADGAGMEKRGLEEQTFGDYHLYALPGVATLRDRETQSLVMLEPRDVKVAPLYLFRPDGQGVRVQLVVKNVKEGGLGVPLPAGRVRTYEADASGALQFAGETTIAHTAEGETLTLDVGRAFDLVAERKQLADRRISDREREQTVEIALRNRKTSATTIVVEENVPGDWEILKSSLPWTRKDANTVRFEIPLAAGREVTLSYTARVRW
jgi:hypothetical protein